MPVLVAGDSVAPSSVVTVHVYTVVCVCVYEYNIRTQSITLCIYMYVCRLTGSNVLGRLSTCIYSYSQSILYYMHQVHSYRVDPHRTIWYVYSPKHRA